MARKIVPKTSFLGGEAGYLAHGRSDLTQFQQGASRIRNFIADRSGPVTRRPGTRFVKGTQANATARLIDFVISYDDASLMFCVEITAAAGVLVFRVIRASDNTVYTPVVSTAISSTKVNIQEIQYVQSADTLFMVHRNMPPIVLRRTAAAPTFAVDLYIGLTGVATRRAQFSVPYRDVNISSTTMTPSATSGSITLTASAAFFTLNMVGAYFILYKSDGTTWGGGIVTAFTSSTIVSMTLTDSLSDTTATTIWYEGAWSKERGYPRTIALYNQRLVFGGNYDKTDTIWLSKTSNYWQMYDIPATAGVSDPLSFTLASAKLNEIHWMVGGKKLTIGTSTSEWVGIVEVSGTTLNVQFDEETTHGSAYAQAKKMGYTIPFIQRSGSSIRELVFSFYSDNYVATDLTLFSSHIGTAHDTYNQSAVNLLQFAFSSSPFNILWAIDSVGRLYSLTRDNQQQIACWTSHVIGGKNTAPLATPQLASWPAQVISICTMPSPDTSTGAVGGKDRLWMVVKRVINSVDTYTVEYMDDIRANPYLIIGQGIIADSGTTPFGVNLFLDCADLQAVSVATTDWAGYTRFASDNAYVVAVDGNGNVVQCGVLAVASNGHITLPVAATMIVVGQHARAEIRGLPMEGGEQPQITQRSKKRTDVVSMRLHETFNLKIGPNKIMRKNGYEEQDDFELVPFDATAAYPKPTFTGEKEAPVPAGNDSDGSYALALDEPWPCTILSTSSRVVWDEV